MVNHLCGFGRGVSQRFTRATIGFGDALLAMPLLALMLDVRLVTPLVALLSTASAIWMLLHTWRQVAISTAVTAPFLLGSMVILSWGSVLAHNCPIMDGSRQRKRVTVTLFPDCARTPGFHVGVASR